MFVGFCQVHAFSTQCELTNTGLTIVISTPMTTQVLCQMGLYKPAKFSFLGVILFYCVVVRVAYSDRQFPLEPS